MATRLSQRDGQGSILEILALVGRRYVPLVGHPHFLSGPLLMGQSTGTCYGLDLLGRSERGGDFVTRRQPARDAPDDADSTDQGREIP